MRKEYPAPPRNPMRGLCIAAVSVAFLFASAAHAAAPSDGESAAYKVETGFAAYLKDGSEAAVTTWLKDGPYEGDAKLTASIVNDMSVAEQRLGKAESYEVIKETPVSSRSRVVFSELYYPKGEEFFLFQMYRSKDGEWLVTNMESNNHVFEILPKDVIMTK